MKNNFQVTSIPLEDMTIKDLRRKLTTKSNYAELVAQKASEHGFNLTKSSIYNTIQQNGGAHEDVIKKVLISIIRERTGKLEAIV